MESLFIDLQYFPPINWFIKSYKYGHIAFFAYEPHRKMSFRNRMLIASADGPLRLSVPLEDARNEKQVYRDVKIQSGHWQRDQLRTLVSCYKRSPWFDHYHDELAVLLEKPDRFLLDFNLRCLAWVEKTIQHKLPWELENALEACRVITGKTDDFRNGFLPSGFADWSVSTDAVKPYTQVFEDRNGFIPGLSILDLIFCEGPAARSRIIPGAK